MKLEFPVPATYLDVLKPGLEVIATTRVFAGQIFKGRVKSVGSRVDPSTRAVRVRALLPNPERTLKPGMLMLVELLKNPRETLMIPEEALVPLGEQQFVFVVNKVNEAVRTEIKIGSRRPGEVEVVDGLQAGDQVITHGTLKVKPGKPVTIIAVDDGSLSLPELLEALRGQGQ
jgi:membrane fusion protein (multidrug efflux system)